MGIIFRTLRASVFGLVASLLASTTLGAPAVFRIAGHSLPPSLDPGQRLIAKVCFRAMTDVTPPYDRPAMLLKSRVDPSRQFRVTPSRIVPWRVDPQSNSVQEVVFTVDTPSHFPAGEAVVIVQMFRKSDGPPERWEPAIIQAQDEETGAETQFAWRLIVNAAQTGWPVNRHVVGASPHFAVDHALRDIPQRVDPQAEMQVLNAHGIDFILNNAPLPAEWGSIPGLLTTHAGPEALAQGAEAFGKAGAYYADPIVIDAMTAKGIMLATTHRAKDTIFAIGGLDEPWGAKNLVLAGPEDRTLGLRAAVYREVRQQFGAGKIDAPASEKDADPLAWIAFHRWYDRQFQTLQSRLYRGIKQVDPQRLVMGHDFFFLRCVPCWDYAEMGKSIDACMLDPYHQRIASEAPLRALYHAGFSTKLVADLTGKPTLPIPGFMEYWRDTPTPEECLELAEQVLRCGAAGLMYYLVDWGKYRYLRYPSEGQGRWDVLMRISAVLHETPRIVFPPTRTLVLFPTDSYAAVNEARADELYVAHAALGENAHVWYRFISDRQIERGEGGLTNAAVLYVPYAPYIESRVVQRVLDFVHNGGTLVLGDSQCFSQTPLGEPTDPVLRQALLPANDSRPAELWPADGGLPEVRVMASGQGRVVLPASPVFTLNNTGSESLAGLVKRIQALAGGDGPSDVWNFSLPRERILGKAAQ